MWCECSPATLSELGTAWSRWMKPWGLAAARPGRLREWGSKVWLFFLQPGEKRGGIRASSRPKTGGPQHPRVLRSRQTHKSPGPYPIPQVHGTPCAHACELHHQNLLGEGPGMCISKLPGDADAADRGTTLYNR